MHKVCCFQQAYPMLLNRARDGPLSREMEKLLGKISRENDPLLDFPYSIFIMKFAMVPLPKKSSTLNEICSKSSMYFCFKACICT